MLSRSYVCFVFIVILFVLVGRDTTYSIFRQNSKVIGDCPLGWVILFKKGQLN